MRIPFYKSATRIRSQRRYYESLAALEKKVYQLNMQPDISIREVADTLLEGMEALYPGALFSILRLHPDGSLRHFSAPHLPKEYSELVDGSLPGPAAGSCGTAVFLKKPVIVSDIDRDPLWKDVKAPALERGLRACWSMPIYHSKGAILGTFAVYYAYINTPDEATLQTLERLANLMGMLIENSEMVENLRLSNQRYHLAAKATHDMIWDWDLEKNEIFRSDEGLRTVFGLWDNGPILKVDDWIARIHPEDRPAVHADVLAVQRAAAGTTFNAEYRFLREDGKYAYVSDRGYIQRNAEGKPLRVIGAVKDITEQVRAIQLLQDSEERYRHLFDNNPLPAWIFDLETHGFLEVNQMAVRHYGYTAEEFAKMTVYDIRPPQEQLRLDKLLHQLSEQSYLHGKWQHVKKSRELIHVEVFSHRITYKGRTAILAVVNDITQNIRLHDQLARERNQRETDVMKATIGAQEKERYELGKELHDNVNQILTSSKLYLDCVKMYDDQKEEYRSTCYSLIDNAIEEIRRLCKSLSPPRLKDVSLIQCIEDILRNVEVTTSVHIEFIYDNFDESVLEEGLKVTIYRILQEQTTNILRHARASKMTIQLDNTAEALSISVADDGIGFDKKTMRHGVGITNMINRASIYAGEMVLHSAPREGCTLSFLFPHKTRKKT